MSNLFFYGTLRHLPLLRVVLGRAGDDLEVEPARLPGYRVVGGEGPSRPTIEARPGSSAQGTFVRGLTAGDIRRLEFYNGGTGCVLRQIAVELDAGETAAALMFLPVCATRPDAPHAGAAWSLDDWTARCGALTVRAAGEVMDWYGRKPAGEVARDYPAIRRRAASWLTAQARPADPRRDLAKDVVVQTYRRPYLNFFSVEEADLRHRLQDGSLGEAINRTAILVGEVAAVLPYDPVRDCVLLIEQFRAPVYMTGDRSPWIEEVIAGLIDPGESAEETAHREAMEEAGIVIDRLEPAGQVYSSVGSSSEFVNLFIGLADLGQTREGGGGVDSEGEDIACHIIGFDELMRGIDAGRYRMIQLVTAALWLARHRDRLRDGA